MTDTASLAAAIATLPHAAGRVAPPRLSPDGVASVILDVTGLDEMARGILESDVRRVLLAVEGVREVRAVQTAEKHERRLIAVGSGKGGVGKSTLSANLAIALEEARLSHRAGRCRHLRPLAAAADGGRGRAPDRRIEACSIPSRRKWGVPMLSMGQLVAADKALAWRGPMASGALGQLVDARWGETDTLVVDLPPGTGDVQLSMIQKHRPAGAVIVSTPQDLALIDAARAIDLFNTAGIPVIGIVENMAGYVCPHCGEVSDPFGNGGAEAEAARLGIPFLGRVPLDIAIRRASDAGEPPAARDDAAAEPFLRIAEAVARGLNLKRALISSVV